MRPDARLGAVRLAAVLAIAGAVNARLNAALIRTPSPHPPATAERVVVCVPARDEEENIGQLLGDLRAQIGADLLEVHVLDDGSTDSTAAVVRAADADLHTGRPLAPGWLGKPAACQSLADIAWAGARRPDVLVFVDADVRLSTHAIAAAVALLRGHHLALLSPWPAQLAGTTAERVIQPLQQWSWLVTVPLRVAERSGRPAFAAANGQFLVLDAAAYRSVGGHGAVAAEVLEDIALARVLRRAGHRTATAAGATIARCRMYSGGAQVRAGYGKSLWTAFGSPAGAAGVLALLVGVYVAPPVAALLGTGAVRTWGCVGWAAGVHSRVVSARVATTRAWPDSALHPVSVLALAALTVDSFRARRRGLLTWKGRRLP